MLKRASFGVESVSIGSSGRSIAVGGSSFSSIMGLKATEWCVIMTGGRSCDAPPVLHLASLNSVVSCITLYAAQICLLLTPPVRGVELSTPQKGPQTVKTPTSFHPQRERRILLSLAVACSHAATHCDMHLCESFCLITCLLACCHASTQPLQWQVVKSLHALIGPSVLKM